MKNVTLSLDEKELEAGRKYAQEHGMSLNALIRDLLKRNTMSFSYLSTVSVGVCDSAGDVRKECLISKIFFGTRAGCNTAKASRKTPKRFCVSGALMCTS